MRSIQALGLIVAAGLTVGCKDGGRPLSERPFSRPAAPEAAPVSVQGPRTLVKIDGREVEAPPGSTVEFETRTDRTAKGVGAALSTENAETAAGFNAGAPNTSLGGDEGGNATGGNLAASLKMRLPSGSSPLVWLGAACLLGAGACFYFQLRRGAVICAALGLGFICAEAVPGWAKAILFIVGLVGLVAYLWSEWKSKRHHEALRAVVAGVAGLDTITQDAAKEEIAKHADDSDKKVIKAVKRADDL